MEAIDLYLRKFGLSEELHAHVVVVMGAMPETVRQDLMSDSGFMLTELWPGGDIPVPLPLGRRKPGRAVVLKRRMWRSDEPFVRWVIAHELAHAHLRNGGTEEHADPEHAADALAAAWGFRRP